MERKKDGSGPAKRPAVAYLRLEFLPLSEVFLYGEIRHVRKFRALVLCAKRSNAESFPLGDVHCVGGLPLPERLWNRMSLAFFRRAGFFDGVIRAKRPAIIHAEFGYEGLFALHLKRKFGIPLVTSFRGFDVYRLPKERPGIYRDLFREGDVFLPRSESMKNDLVKLGCPRKKVIVHHSAIDVKKFRLVKRRLNAGEPARVLFVGRLVEKKGAAYAIEAFAKVLGQFGNAKLRLVGDGPLHSSLEKKVEALGLGDAVSFLGSLPHERVIAEMENSHLMLMPYVTAADGDKEGIPNVLMEAMATGLPVVSTLHSGIPELVEDGRSGFLVPEGDVEALAERSLEVLNDPKEWARFGRAGRQKVLKEFNIYKQTAKLERIYSDILG